MERHWDYHVPALPREFGNGGCDQQSGQKLLQPELPTVFISVDQIQNHFLDQNGGATSRKKKFQGPAITALERDRNRTLKRKAATLAKWSFDLLHPVAAILANKSLARVSRL